ncbi:hypothetical protein, partial [Rhodoblastus acidophilus]|uniref:hypothetical protein n=1 Tax=Rhodoblastus acidophilus TaxID=1074 RepID=UPI000DBC3154
MCDLQLEDDDAAAKAARTKTFHITTAEGDGDGRWYEIFVRSPIDRAALVGADPDEFEFDQLKKVGTTLRVTIAASYPYKDERGD